MTDTPQVYGVDRIMGAETEYGVIAPTQPGTNPTVLSAMVVNTYAQLASKSGEALREQVQRAAHAAQLAQRGETEEYESTVARGEQRQGVWSSASESPLTDAYGETMSAEEAHASQMTHTRRELTSEDIALEVLREAGIDQAATIHGRGGYPERLDWDAMTMNAILPNGARLYVDHAHPEYSSPETRSPLDAVRYDAAGDVIAYRACREIAAHSELPPVSLYKNNTDSKGQSYGAHENYMLSRETEFEDIVAALLPFFATRSIMIGAGRVGIGRHGEQPGFQISSRADFFERLVGLETTLRRPLINTRDEPHANSAKYRRLHVIPADANLSHYSNFLKFGTAALVLNLIESSKAPFIQLADPVYAFQQVSHDLSLSVQLPLAYADADLNLGESVTALQVQRIFLDACRTHEEANPAGVDAQTRQVLELWDEVLTALETDPLSLADRLDWVAKYSLVRGYMAKGVPADSPKLAALDLQYADIDPDRGLYHRLVARGRMRTLFNSAQIEQAIIEPPADTRAYLRGTLMHRFGHEIIGINWDSVSARGRYSRELTRLVMDEPAAYTREQVEPLLARVHHSDQLLQALRDSQR